MKRIHAGRLSFCARSIRKIRRSLHVHRALPALLLTLMALGGAGRAVAAPLYFTQELLPLPGNFRAHAVAINAAGAVVGWSRSADGTNSAVLWQRGSVVNLSSRSAAEVSVIPMDINDRGQIVGFIQSCPEPCSEPFGTYISPWQGDGPWSALAPGSAAPLPMLEKCTTDSRALRISNAGYTLVETALNSPHGTSPLCLYGQLLVSELYENGIVATTNGFVYDPVIEELIYVASGETDRFAPHRAWVFTPGCSQGNHAYPLALGPGLRVTDDVNDALCDLIATGYSRDRQHNAAGQFFVNAGDRVFLLTPIPEPGSLLLSAILLPTMLLISRRKRLAEHRSTGTLGDSSAPRT